MLLEEAVGLLLLLALEPLLLLLAEPAGGGCCLAGAVPVLKLRSGGALCWYMDWDRGAGGALHGTTRGLRRRDPHEEASISQ